MIDIEILRHNPEVVRESQRRRGDDEEIVTAAITLDDVVRLATRKFEDLRAEQKRLGVELRSVQGDERVALLERASSIASKTDEARTALSQARNNLELGLRRIGNLVEPGVPAGDENNFRVIETHGLRRNFSEEGFEPRDHVALGDALGLWDIARGVKVSGSRFYYLTGIGALLEMAIMRMALDYAVDQGFTPLVPPVLVGPHVMEATGYLDRHADAVYRVEDEDLFLTGTSEVALAGFHFDEIISVRPEPKRYAALSTCFRKEAGTYGRDTRGIMRVHQFQKVEMFSYCPDEQAGQEHEYLLKMQKYMLDALELPYRVIDTAAGDLGDSAARKYDCEAWIPSENRFREMTSSSNCRTFQSRRLNVRERSDGKSRPVATLNGTLATTRWIVALLENHQQGDGSVRVPEALRSFLSRDYL